MNIFKQWFDELWFEKHIESNKHAQNNEYYQNTSQYTVHGHKYKN